MAQIVENKELIITHLSVVNSQLSKTGVWSFPQFMKYLSGPAHDPAEFTERWLMTWATDTMVNGKNVSGTS